MDAAFLGSISRKGRTRNGAMRMQRSLVSDICRCRSSLAEAPRLRQQTVRDILHVTGQLHLGTPKSSGCGADLLMSRRDRCRFRYSIKSQSSRRPGVPHQQDLLRQRNLETSNSSRCFDALLAVSRTLSQILLDRGADLETPDSCRSTPLHYASFGGAEVAKVHRPTYPLLVS